VHNLATSPTTDPEISSVASYDDSGASSFSITASSVAAPSDITSSDGLSDTNIVFDVFNNEVDATDSGNAYGMTAITVEEEEVAHDGLVNADVESNMAHRFITLFAEA
jgi:hypothetical protein